MSCAVSYPSSAIWFSIRFVLDFLAMYKMIPAAATKDKPVTILYESFMLLIFVKIKIAKNTTAW